MSMRTAIPQTIVAYKLTVRDFFLAFIASKTAGVPTYEQEGDDDKIWRLPTVKTIQVTPDSTSKKIYASGITYDVAQRTKGASAAIGMIALPRAVIDKALGATASGAVSIDATGDGTKAAEFSCGYYMDNSNGSLVYFFHPRCKLVPGAEDANDIGDNDPDPNESYTVEIMPTEEGVWRVRYHTEDAAVGKIPLTPEEFFSSLPYRISQIEALSASEHAATELKSLTIGALVLSPAFAPGTTQYTASTGNAGDAVTARAYDDEATIVITHGSTAVDNGAAPAWTEGANTLTVAVTKGGTTKTYTVTVTRA